MKTKRSLIVVALMLSAGACRKVPEAETPAAQLYVQRCSDPCHKVFLPGTMKYEMWKYQVERMQGEMVRRGIDPLTPAETQTILEYLKRHAG